MNNDDSQNDQGKSNSISFDNSVYFIMLVAVIYPNDIKIIKILW